mmetsp:Transcript_122934/g.393828  ORF Transcript_122934/g.393828 Transcript_122934/m.393828 type:complete len:358 (+) Transcript_122934:94-1167(+)
MPSASAALAGRLRRTPHISSTSSGRQPCLPGHLAEVVQPLQHVLRLHLLSANRQLLLLLKQAHEVTHLFDQVLDIATHLRRRCATGTGGTHTFAALRPLSVPLVCLSAATVAVGAEGCRRQVQARWIPKWVQHGDERRGRAESRDLDGPQQRRGPGESSRGGRGGLVCEGVSTKARGESHDGNECPGARQELARGRFVEGQEHGPAAAHLHWAHFARPGRGECPAAAALDGRGHDIPAQELVLLVEILLLGGRGLVVVVAHAEHHDLPPVCRTRPRARDSAPAFLHGLRGGVRGGLPLGPALAARRGGGDADAAELPLGARGARLRASGAGRRGVAPSSAPPRGRPHEDLADVVQVT